MKLYESIGPNPRVVKIFLAEKSLDVERHNVDIMAAENRSAAYLEKVNPAGQSPALMLDDGTVIAEVTAICEYLEETQPTPPLIGSTAAERAETRMWTRRVDLRICEPLANGFRFAEGLEMFKDRMRCLPESADGLKAIARDNLAWLEQQIDGREWLAGTRFTLADILLFSFLEFGNQVGQPLGNEFPNLAQWYQRVEEREAVRAAAK